MHFVVLGFLLMYFITGWIMTHHDWFEHPGAKEQVKTHRLELPQELSPEEYAILIQNKFGLNGQRKEQSIAK